VVNIPRNIDDQASSLIEALMQNPRASIRQLATQLNLEYNYVRRLLKRLFSKKQLVPALAASTSILGREAAVIRVKSNSPASLAKIEEFARQCNRVVSYIEVNGTREVMIIVTAENKQKTVKLVELICSIADDVVEVSAEYGTLPRDALLPLKNSCSKCIYSNTCNNNTELTLFRNSKVYHVF
jgi:DNA-binding Lrp family transcriptional regulator